jgi:hypothetical protein
MGTMTIRKIRPDFELPCSDDTQVVMSRLRSRLAECPLCTGVSVGRHVELFVPENERRIWSPWLSVSVEDSQHGSMLRGRFGPHPHIWTWYLFCAFGLGFSVLVGLTLGYAQWAIESTPWALLLVPASLLAAAALYSLSLLGQRLSAEHIDRLRHALEVLIES